MDKIHSTYKVLEPDIVLQDEYGKLEFFNLTRRQFSLLKKVQNILILSQLCPNDQELGEKVRKILKGE